MKLVERELGPHHVACDIGCHLFSTLPPFNLGATTMGYGLGWASAAALNTKETTKRTISFMGDGGFWHNGLTSGVGNAVFNQSDSLLVVVDNSYTAATGGQDILSSDALAIRFEHKTLDCRRRARSRSEMGTHHHAHLRRRQNARHLHRSAHHERKRARKSSSRKANAR